MQTKKKAKIKQMHKNDKKILKTKLNKTRKKHKTVKK